MAIDPTSSATTTGTAGNQVQRDNTVLGKDDFLKILVGQLSNMDPMSADSNDPTQSMAQMTQFSILEQLTNLSSAQDSIATSQKQSQALNLLGKTVSYKAADGTATQGTVNKVDFANDGSVKLTLADGTTITPADVSGVQ